MYEVVRPERKIGTSDGWRTEPEQRRTFHTAAGLFRWALRERVFSHRTGGVPYPTRFDDVHLGDRNGDEGYDYHLIDTFTPWEITGEHLAAMRRVQRRYAEIVHYLREVEPGWEPDTSVSPTGKISYADNSVVLYEISKYGGKRSRTLVAPHGDACF
jgi:hypothetical protein